MRVDIARVRKRAADVRKVAGEFEGKLPSDVWMALLDAADELERTAGAHAAQVGTLRREVRRVQGAIRTWKNLCHVTTLVRVRVEDAYKPGTVLIVGPGGHAVVGALEKERDDAQRNA